MKKILIFIFMTVLSSPAISGSYPCNGQIDLLAVTRDGSVEIYSTQMFGNKIKGRVICNISSIRKSVTPETCKSWYSTLLAQKAINSSSTIYYLDHEARSCSAVPEFGNAVAPHAVADGLL